MADSITLSENREAQCGNQCGYKKYSNHDKLVCFLKDFVRGQKLQEVNDFLY